MLELITFICEVSCGICKLGEDLDFAACALEDVRAVGEVEALAVGCGLPANIGVFAVDNGLICTVLIDVVAGYGDRGLAHSCAAGCTAVIRDSVSYACGVGIYDHVLLARCYCINELEYIVACDGLECGSFCRSFCRSLGGSVCRLLGGYDDIIVNGDLLEEVDLLIGAVVGAGELAVIAVYDISVVAACMLELTVVDPASVSVLYLVKDADLAALAVKVIGAVGQVKATLAVIGGLPADSCVLVVDNGIVRAVLIDVEACYCNILRRHSCAAGRAAAVFQSISSACNVSVGDDVFLARCYCINELEYIVACDGSEGRSLCGSFCGFLGGELAVKSSLLIDKDVSA